MAVRIIEGVPGSGKTYYAVRHLAKSYFKKEKDGSYVLDKPCTIITNIDQFKPDHVSLLDEIKKAGGVTKFFAIKYQEEYRQGKEKIVYIIDEAQMLFRKRMKGMADVYSYFEYHRHWGQDIYLVTQNTRKLPGDITLLCETIIQACPRIRSITGEMKYKWMSGGDVLKREAFRPDPGVFDLYKSMDAEETEKIKNPMMKTVYIVLGITVFVFLLGAWYFKKTWGNYTKSDTVKKESTQQSNVVPVVSNNNQEQKPSLSIEHLIPVSVIKQTTSGRLKIMLVWQNNLISPRAFPYKTTIINNQWYAILDHDLFLILYPDQENPPKQIVRMVTPTGPERLERRPEAVALR